ncbi:uncharacterized protein [Clytia hemisphaerica]|uniref:uncharacterized protein n=1 Tax=Clytia hemisphaerica TaxID=252671 RepID=UPI0034D46D31|eukprot:TCONS_00001178-protein
MRTLIIFTLFCCCATFVSAELESDDDPGSGGGKLSCGQEFLRCRDVLPKTSTSSRDLMKCVHKLRQCRSREGKEKEIERLQCLKKCEMVQILCRKNGGYFMPCAYKFVKCRRDCSYL